MLAELRIRDFAVIEKLSVRLDPGLNVLTGETGAGKSIIVGALSLLLGERASSDVVREGAAHAVVEGVFEVDDGSAAVALLAEQGIDCEDGLVILRREVAAEGRNRAWINGSPTTAALVGEIGRTLADLHGQSEHEALVRPERQRRILDAFAGCSTLAAEVAEAHNAVRATRATLDRLEAGRQVLRERAEFLRAQAEEIEKASIRPDEEEELEAEARRLDHAEDLARLSARLHHMLYSAEDAVAGRLDEARRLIAQLLEIDAAASESAAQLDDAFFLVEDLGRRMRDYASSVEYDPARLNALRRRQDLLFRLRSRYGPTLGDVIEAGHRARTALDQLEGSDLEQRDLERALVAASERLARLCESLTTERALAATRLGSEVEALLPGLGMSGGTFQVALSRRPEPGAHGAEDVEFRVALNAGFEARPIGRIASGGELSRLMLALRTILSRADTAGTLVFDEIDTGVGGRVAHSVADRLREVARSHQVFVVTHLAQIAARADHHLLVEKVSTGQRAATHVREVRGEMRVGELARLLGGDPESDASLEHARELLVAAGG
jgi:DNA repair protein RecN (Recombination protein N)